MGGLIPLLLPATAGMRSSIMASNRSSVIYNPVETGRPSTSASIPISDGHQRQLSASSNTKSGKRFSIPVPPALPVLPYTPAEWKKAVNEVKRKFVNRKFRSCSARCCEILDHLRDPSSVEPLYLVYLHFYAASSLEMCARPLSESSPCRAKLLTDSLHHYDMAAIMISKAEDATTQKSSKPDYASSISSSLHSPSMSISSMATTRSSLSTAPSTPRTSFGSAIEASALMSQKRPKPKKKVAFSDDLPQSVEVEKPWESEPFIRPDSPTLGWEGNFLVFGRYESTVKENEVPQPMSCEPAPEASMDESHLASNAATLSVDSEPFLKPSEDRFDLETFLQNKSRDRMCSKLGDLRSQIAGHRDNIKALLVAEDDIPETPCLPEIPPIPPMSAIPVLSPTGQQTMIFDVDRDDSDSPATPCSAVVSPPTMDQWLSLRLKKSIGDLSSLDLGEMTPPVRKSSFSSTRPSSVMSTRTTSDDDIQQRIERLRANGWRRKRFDRTRYETLRERALGELAR